MKEIMEQVRGIVQRHAYAVYAGVVNQVHTQVHGEIYCQTSGRASRQAIRVYRPIQDNLNR